MVATIFAGSVVAEGPVSASDPNHGRDYLAERAAVERAWQMLDQKWSEWIANSQQSARAQPRLPLQKPGARIPAVPGLRKLEEENKLPRPQRRSLALTSLNGYHEPGEMRPVDGTLVAQLAVTYARNQIGPDPVWLRSYNGQLVGPTLRARPGDVMRITVRNTLPTQPWKANSMNKLHDFNTTNLHTHGLHVSPNGISDNVLLEIAPGATQEYVIAIPEDHPCGTFWYHPHHHGSTAANVASGMSGALIIEGGLDDLPAIKTAKERVMVLNQILYVNRIPPAEPGGSEVKLPEGVIEEEYAGYNLGPGDAATLGRFTTINGVQLPVIRMRPGQIERWRLIDSAQSEIIQLQLVDAKTLQQVVPFHEIAVDGLALGKAVKQDFIQLLPGYRSDVLVSVPQAGEYLLVDMAKLGMKATSVPLQYVARVIVEGEPVTGMQMPADDEMRPFRLPSLAGIDKKDVGTQTASYGIFPILPPGKGARFLIDNQSFDLNQARALKLNTVDEWQVSVKNGFVMKGDQKIFINTGHPFHIHVNPFEITSIRGPQDPANPESEQVELLAHGPVWRDTIWVPNNGTVTFRTRYEDFIGTFVQHCHILDHEDQGMMQLIDIYDPAKKTASAAPESDSAVPATGTPAPDFDLPDASGQRQRLHGRPAARRIVFLFKGHGCLHCAEQVREFTALHAKFRAHGIEVIGITSDSLDVLKTALVESPCPFTLLADPDARAFAAFGCARSGGLIHGTFLMDENNRVLWRTTGASPFLNVSKLLEIAPPSMTAAAPTPQPKTF
jgi:FtsP/CotA-like multicopper oxidase with cupredoxin domain/peroxiredoxin